MKKNLCKTLALCLVMLMAFSVVAYADASMSRDTSAADDVKIKVTGVRPSDEVTLLVVPKGAALSTIKAEEIIYIDQETADADGNAEFTFAKPEGDVKFDAYSGFTSMTLAQALSDPDKSGDTPGGDEKPDVDMTKSKMYDSAFELDGFKRIFVKLIDENGQWMPSHSGDGSTIYYSVEREGYDGLIKSGAANLEIAIGELNWTKIAPTGDEIINRYGDANGDDDISAGDYKRIVDYFMGKKIPTNKDRLISDVSNDSDLSAADYKSIVNKIMKEDAYTFKVVSDR